MFNNSRLEKIKEGLLFVLKSAIFLYLVKKVVFTISFILFFIFCLITAENSNFFQYTLMSLLSDYLHIILSYFTAKKLGIIKILDSLSLGRCLIIVFIFEIILTLSLPVNIGNLSFRDYIIKEWGRIISNTISTSLYNFGFIYTFISYKLAKLLIKKYPKNFAWLVKLYPSKLEKIISFTNFKKIWKKFFKKTTEC